MAAESDFLSPAELAEMLNVPVSTVRKWIHEGSAPSSYKIGRHRRFARADVDRWLDERRDEPKPVA